MNIPFVDLKAQYISIKSEIDNAIQNVLTDTAFIKGKYVEEFEKNFAKELNAKHCIGVANGTDAITISLKALGVGMGDEVITAANSFIATSEAISNSGAKVVFVDCHPDTYNIDVNKIEEKITNKTKAIIPVHLYGQPADLDFINKIAKKYSLYIIEDSAQAHFAEYKSKSEDWKRIG
ncbi:MAG: aminotransferase class I/II-fold pyridoxal phosphate-dependent enzyme, partial [Bacteroidales bacterium]|nr:aminotransferase class I/II-fold pyridoxal phosphate-dependent enzyme [Bacteroidales bacterium]